MGNVFAARTPPAPGTTCHPRDPKPLFICQETKTFVRYPHFCIITEPKLPFKLSAILVNYGLYLRTNQEKFQCDGIFLSLSIKRNSCLCLKRSPKLTEKCTCQKNARAYLQTLDTTNCT